MITQKPHKTLELTDHWLNESEWAVELLASVERFIEIHAEQPTHVIVHPSRLNRMSMQVSASMSHEVGRFEFQHLGVFACELAEVQIIAEETIEEGEYILKAEKSGNDYGKPTNDGFFIHQGTQPAGKPAAAQALAGQPQRPTSQPIVRAHTPRPSRNPKDNPLRSQLKILQGGKK